MKTQISNFRSGTKNQILNPNVDYSQLPKATSHNGHAGSNDSMMHVVWGQIVSENPEKLIAIIDGVTVEFTANTSLSGKTTTYFGSISKEIMQEKFHLMPSKKNNPSISIQSPKHIEVSNGKNSFTHICPSLIEII